MVIHLAMVTPTACRGVLSTRHHTKATRNYQSPYWRHGSKYCRHVRALPTFFKLIEVLTPCFPV